MTLYEKIRFIYPQLQQVDFVPDIGTIELRDDSNGMGPYIAKWTNELPQPTKEQLDAI